VKSPVSRRHLLLGAASTATLLSAPAVTRAQAREVVVAGAAGQANLYREFLFPVIERRHNVRVLFEGTRSLVNLEKLRADRARPKIDVVYMDDPVMIVALEEGLIEPLTPQTVPNLSRLVPTAVLQNGAWANFAAPWVGVAYNTRVMRSAPTSWAELWDPRHRAKVIIPSLQNTEGVWLLFVAAHLETGKPMQEAQYDIDAGFRRLRALKPNLLNVYTNLPQAQNLLETGEASMVAGQMSAYTLPRKMEGAPIDLAMMREAVFSMPWGVGLVKGAPTPALGHMYLNEILGVEIQKILLDKTVALPTNRDVAVPAGILNPADRFVPDWSFVAKNRSDWIDRFNREMS
jgi:putative spermidine/putrescine transport system substrate-binding protein